MFYGEKILKTRAKKKPKRKPTKKIPIFKAACQWAQLLAKLEETDADGYGYCVSCGKLFSWTELNGGHYQPKGTNYNGACLDERNIHAQCVGCNVHKGGNPAGYTGYMVRAHGLDVIDELKQKSYRLLDRFDVLDFIRATAEECKAMAKEKTFRVNFPPIPKDAR